MLPLAHVVIMYDHYVDALCDLSPKSIRDDILISELVSIENN